MTKRRSALTFERALSSVAGSIGWAAAAAIVGRSENTVRNWSDEDSAAGIRLDAALRLDVAFHQAGGEGWPFLHCYALRVEADSADAGADAHALTRAAAVAAREGGEAIEATIAAALCSDDPRLRAKAELELEQGIAAFTNTLSRLRSGAPAAPASSTTSSCAPEVAPPAPIGA